MYVCLTQIHYYNLTDISSEITGSIVPDVKDANTTLRTLPKSEKEHCHLWSPQHACKSVREASDLNGQEYVPKHLHISTPPIITAMPLVDVN